MGFCWRCFRGLVKGEEPRKGSFGFSSLYTWWFILSVSVSLGDFWVKVVFGFLGILAKTKLPGNSA